MPRRQPQYNGSSKRSSEGALDEREALARAFATYSAQREKPARVGLPLWDPLHLIRNLKQALTQLDERLDPDLHGRLKVVQVSNLPAGTSFLTEDVISAFVVTDVIAAGLLTLGQTIERQAQQQASESAPSPIWPVVTKKNTRCWRIYPLKVPFGPFTWPTAPSTMVRVACISNRIGQASTLRRGR